MKPFLDGPSWPDKTELHAMLHGPSLQDPTRELATAIQSDTPHKVYRAGRQQLALLDMSNLTIESRNWKY